jgi:AcrR family transcriptional regulator
VITMHQPSAEQILDTALILAEDCGWERLRLFAIAEQLGVGLDAIARHYTDKDQLVEAWFDRADQAMLIRSRDEALSLLSPAQRLEELLLAWFAPLDAHRRLTRQMLLYKFEPAHLHLQLQGLLRISHTVQWWREAAQRGTSHVQRVAEECALSAVYLSTVYQWLSAPYGNLGETRAHLRTRLRRGPLRMLLRDQPP